jgi:hypothetical protein
MTSDERYVDNNDRVAVATAVKYRVCSSRGSIFEMADEVPGVDLPTLEDGGNCEGSPLCIAEPGSETESDHDRQNEWTLHKR